MLPATGAGEATGGTAAAPTAGRPRGPANNREPSCAPAEQPSAYVRMDNGAWLAVANPRLGEGPSSAPPCPGNNYMWLQGAWRQVIHHRPYVMVAAEHGSSSRNAGRARPCSPASTAAAAMAPALQGHTAAQQDVQPPRVNQATRGHARVHRHKQVTRGYQVLVWGPRRDSTTISQVQLAAKDLLEGVGQGLPSDLLGGRAS